MASSSEHINDSQIERIDEGLVAVCAIIAISTELDRGEVASASIIIVGKLEIEYCGSSIYQIGF